MKRQPRTRRRPAGPAPAASGPASPSSTPAVGPAGPAERPAAANVRTAMNGLRRVVRALRLSDAETSRALGLSAAQLFVLQEVAHSPGLSIGQLADLTQTDPSSVSVVVTRLEGHGLIERKPAAADARRLEIRATPIGVAVVRGAPQAVQVRMIEALSALTPARLRGFVATLDELARAMGMEEGAPPMFFEEARPAGGSAPGDVAWAPNDNPAAITSTVTPSVPVTAARPSAAAGAKARRPRPRPSR